MRHCSLLPLLLLQFGASNAVRLAQLGANRPNVRARAVRVRGCAESSLARIFNATIDQMLETSDVNLPSMMSKNLKLLTNPEFIGTLNARIASTPSGSERTRLEACQMMVLNFLEEVTDQIIQLEPELAEAQAQVDRARTEAAVRPSRKPSRRSAGSPSAFTPGAAATGMVASNATVDDLHREIQAKNRFKLEQLLDAAKLGEFELNQAIARLRPQLDNTFFEHMQWEVEQQIKAQNQQLLGILEVVVQRTCAEMELAMPDVQLLGALLQIKNREARRELFARELEPAPLELQASFVQNVQETKLHLEKAVMRGEKVDQELLQSLRVISIEMEDYIKVP
ncbi:hypothetical protein AB1Y20_006719 [Prymnesium parvum]|uniref:Uncharacterized protein n=1 Tax=Prymnesium parvum TaxID=97485 RepID=A0AB34J1G3_PRYPA